MKKQKKIKCNGFFHSKDCDGTSCAVNANPETYPKCSICGEKNKGEWKYICFKHKKERSKL